MPDTLRQFKAGILQALAHPTRIAIVEVLREGEMSAGALIERLGLEQANASQHLAVLRTRQIVVNRKEGNQVFYRLRDPLLLDVLATMRAYFQKHRPNRGRCWRRWATKKRHARDECGCSR